jgi:hypothetical protein
MPLAKGLTFADVCAFVRSAGGEEAFARLCAALSPEHRRVTEEALAIGWYPLEAHLAALEAIPVALGLDLDAAMRGYAQFCAERHVTSIHRVFFLFANPAVVVEKTGEFWTRFYDTGRWTIVRETSSSVRGELADFAIPTRTHCLFMVHYVAALLGRAGAKRVNASHPKCRVRGDAVCAYVASWS